MKATPRAQALALFLGIAVGFGAAVTAGYRATGYSKPSGFRRFHMGIGPESSFYPPFSMLENLALARWSTGKTVVVIGGNSILNGVSQPEAELWSLRLQELLGESYCVVNLSFRGAYPSEGGALVAESLMRRGVPVIYVANFGPGPIARAYDSIYAYLFWQALSLDRLLPNAPRDAQIAALRKALPPAALKTIAAQELAGRLNAPLRFQELWHHVAYRHFSTVWTRYTQPDFWKPRDLLHDPEPSPAPLGQRFQTLPATEMEITRGFSAVFAEPDGSGGWRAAEDSRVQAAIAIDEVFVPPLRACTLMLLSENCRFYRDQLTASERARDDLVFATYEKLWLEHGIRCVTVGNDFELADYNDRTHLTPSGGRKLAQIVATQIRQMHPAP